MSHIYYIASRSTIMLQPNVITLFLNFENTCKTNERSKKKIFTTKITCPPKIKNRVSERFFQNRRVTFSMAHPVLNNTLESFDENLPTDDESEESLKRQKRNVKLQALKLRLARIEARPKNYTGIPEHALVVLHEIVSDSKAQLENVNLTLKKIKTNQAFIILGDEYGKNCTFANIVFRQTIPLLAHYLKPFIFWPSAETIKHVLPLAFRARYNDCNTIKYLISTTPDGMINYISEAFSGRRVKTLRRSEELGNHEDHFFLKLDALQLSFQLSFQLFFSSSYGFLKIKKKHSFYFFSTLPGGDLKKTFTIPLNYIFPAISSNECSLYRTTLNSVQ
ncbi:hypothetical protein RI129_009054 [Pyrocoelia pectoralis]|uniref:Uncharacterized protein n=1 Tax=Pyrocoelia pectoralis TaxID=417401 RepID=A0AAN7ZGH5_9COLE